jgi:hypothetical protein
MTMLLPEALPSFHLKGDDLVTLNMIQDLGFDDSLHVFANGQRVAIAEKDFTELDLITGIAGDARNEQGLILLDLELLPGYFHNC